MGEATSSIRTSIDKAWDNVVLFGPKFVGFLLILLIGYLIAVAAGRIIAKALERVGFDRLVERGTLKQAIERSGYKVSGILGHLAFYALFLFVLQMAFSVFGPNSISDLLKQIISYLPNIFVAIVIVVVAAAAAALVKEIVAASLGGMPYGPVVANATSISIVIIAIFAALSQLGIAQNIVNGIFYALLATLSGSLIVAIGGGGIAPMRTQWEKALARLETETPGFAPAQVSGTEESD